MVDRITAIFVIAISLVSLMCGFHLGFINAPYLTYHFGAQNVDNFFSALSAITAGIILIITIYSHKKGNL